MADLRLFNPAAPLVAIKNGLRINGKTYNIGDVLRDTTVGARKRRQLFQHGKLSHPGLTDLPVAEDAAPPAEVPEAPAAPAAEVEDADESEAPAEDSADDSSDDSEDEAPAPSRKKRSKKKRSSRSAD